MITILMTLSVGKKSIVVGGSQIKGFEQWMLIDSMGFGLSGDLESEQDMLKDNEETKSTTGPNKSKPKKKSSTPQSVSISKTVDSSTVYLMELAAKDRSTTETESRSAKICLFENRSFGPKDKREESVFPVVQLNLGSVLLKDWNINASVGESVASETFSLVFKQFAMVFFGAENGTSFVQHGPKAWDETNTANSGDWPDGKSNWYSS